MLDTQTAKAVDTLLTWKPLRACLRLWPQSLTQHLALDGALAISVPGERGRRQAGRRAQQLCPQEAHCTANRGQTTSTQRARAHSKVRTQGGGPPWPGRQHQPGEVIPGLTGWVRKGSPEEKGDFSNRGVCTEAQSWRHRWRRRSAPPASDSTDCLSPLQVSLPKAGEDLENPSCVPAWKLTCS